MDTLRCNDHGKRTFWPQYWTGDRPACWACGQPAPWQDAVPFDSAPTVPAGWSIVSDGATPQDAVNTAERYRSHGRAAVVTRYGCRALSGAHYVAYRVTVDIAPDDAAWAAYRGQ